MLHFSCGSSTVSLISVKVLVLVILAIMPKEKKILMLSFQDCSSLFSLVGSDV